MLFGLANQVDAQNRRSEREIQNILRNLNSAIDDFRYELDAEFRRASGSRDQIGGSVEALENSVSRFEGKFQRRRDSAADISDIVSAAQSVNDYVNRGQSRKAAGSWKNVRGQIDKLALIYNVRPNWNDVSSNYPNDNRYPSNNNRYPASNSYTLTGTYQLDPARSDNTRDIADRAIRNGNVRNGGNAQSDLENKLQAPEQIAIDVRGNQVTLASSNSKQITFAADGRENIERTDDGRTIRVRSTLRGQELTISSLGGSNDYTVVFASIDNGGALRVTRQITTDYLRQTIFAESIYRKTDATAQLDDYNGYGGSNDGYSNSGGDYSSNDPVDNRRNSQNYPTARTGRSGVFVVPNGAVLTGTLDSDINTKISQNNDRFRMTVQSPNEYRGAVIEGYISGIDRSGKVSGRSQITFNFERIRLPNGRTYDFAGNLRSVTDEKGDIVKIDNEGVVKGDDQTKETIKRGGIGAGIGAIIGAIAGGGKGAAIGAIIGGGAGAGSVIVQGRDDLELKAGSTVTVESSSPIR